VCHSLINTLYKKLAMPQFPSLDGPELISRLIGIASMEQCGRTERRKIVVSAMLCLADMHTG